MDRYSNTLLQTTSDSSGIVTFSAGVKYPEIPFSQNDVYVYTTVGDRLDKLAKQFYGSSEYYWIIASANPEIGFDSLYITEGTQIRIPSNLNNIILSFKQLNNQ